MGCGVGDPPNANKVKKKKKIWIQVRPLMKQTCLRLLFRSAVFSRRNLKVLSHFVLKFGAQCQFCWKLFFCLIYIYTSQYYRYFLKVHLHHSSQTKSHKEVITQIKGFLTSFAWWREDPNPFVRGTGPDPQLWLTDPEHWYIHWNIASSPLLSLRDCRAWVAEPW